MSKFKANPYAPERNCGDLAFDGHLAKFQCDKAIDHSNKGNLQQTAVGDKVYWLCPSAIKALGGRP
jgi:hypothetical protein